MAEFHYLAKNASGRDVAGEIVADNIDDARRMLQDQGMEVIELAPGGPIPPPGPSRLSRSEVQQWTEHIAQISSANLPLAAAFRAVADESPRPRLSMAMNALAEKIEQGRSLENALAESSGWLPRHIGGLVAAAARTGTLGGALLDLVEHQRDVDSLRRKIKEHLAYPIVVTVVATVLLLLLLFTASGTFERMFAEFGLQLPFITKLLFWWRDVGIWLVGGLILALLALAAGFRVLEGEAAWQRFVATVPFFGQMVHWLGLAEWTRLVGVLVKYGVPLPEALRLSADGVSKAHIQELSRSLAQGADRGEEISTSLARHSVPRGIIPLIRWGEKKGTLAQAFTLGSEMLERRVEQRSLILQALLPQFLFIGIACCVLLLVGGLFFPLRLLLTSLS